MDLPLSEPSYLTSSLLASGGAGASPNTITVISFLICLCGSLLFAFGGYIHTLLAGVLIQIASVLDGCDGEVARLLLRGSPFGGWLDTVFDRYGDLLIAIGIAYGFWQGYPGSLPWIGSIMAMSGFILASYTKKEFAIRYRRPLTEGFVGRLIKRDLRIFLLFLGALINRPFEALILTGLLSHLGILWLFSLVYRLEKHKTDQLSRVDSICQQAHLKIENPENENHLCIQ